MRPEATADDHAMIAPGEPDPDGEELESSLDWLELRVEAGAWAGGAFDVVALSERAGEAALLEAGIAPDRAIVSILFTDDAAIKTLNRDHRAKDTPTNVLSWPSLELAGPAAPEQLTPAPFFLGDVALAYETMAAEAQSEGKTLERHAAHLIIHGVLHLLGYDHEDEGEAALMQAREVAALERIGVGSPYPADTESEARQDWD